MRQANRKAATAAYKERKAAPGIYVIRCPAAGLCWVGQAPDVSTIWNRISFMLRNGGHPSRRLQSLWSERQGEGFLYEELERLDEKSLGVGQDRALKERLAHWVAALSALKL